MFDTSVPLELLPSDLFSLADVSGTWTSTVSGSEAVSCTASGNQLQLRCSCFHKRPMRAFEMGAHSLWCLMVLGVLVLVSCHAEKAHTS